jgi:hypothetical protein
MQTILKVVHDNRGQAIMVYDYLSQFCARSANEALSIDDDDNIAFVRDDAYEFRYTRGERQLAQLGSFEHLPNQANGTTQFILINLNPIILLYRRNGQNLRLSVASTSSGAVENSESE